MLNKLFLELSNELLRYGKILQDEKYEIEGIYIRSRKILYEDILWKIIMIDGSVYKIEKEPNCS